MKEAFRAVTVLGVCVSLVLVGCGQKKAASSEEAIETTKSMETAEQKIDYLVKQARAFYNSEEYQDAVDTAKYILKNLDKDSQEARDILEKAKNELTSTVKGAVEDATGALKDLGK